MNVTSLITVDYENKSNWTLGENEPKTNPIKPNFRKAKMNISLYVTKDYENKSNWTLGENKPNSKPILSAIALAKADSKGAPMLLVVIAREYRCIGTTEAISYSKEDSYKVLTAFSVNLIIFSIIRTERYG